MIISNNLPALNTYNRLKLNNQSQQNTMKKLSSGLKINQAVDDAAGLAISQKMKAQIRGLEQAQKNIQDGISLIQTAEGGLSNILDPPLQRMRELIIQAANDTYTYEDRVIIQDEINRLKSTINDIANNTEFNTMKLLNNKDIITYETSIVKQAGVTWEKIDIGASGYLDGTIYFNGKYIAVGENATIATSTDGECWTLDTLGSNRLYNLITNGSQVIALGDHGALYTSNDGENWIQQTFTTDGMWLQTQLQLHDGVWDGSKYIISCDYGYIISSSDGVNWNYVRPNNTQWRGITYGEGQHVIVGNSGEIMTSSDGTNWTAQVSGITKRLMDVTYANGIFVAISDGDVNGCSILTSLDGINWNEQNNPYILRSIIWDGSKFIACGSDLWGIEGAIVTSSDGVSWTNINQSPSLGRIMDIASYDNGKTLFGVTYSGKVLISKAVEETKEIHTRPTLNLQVGANSKQSFVLDIADVRTTTLGIDDVDVLGSCDVALEKVDHAIHIITSERAKLGAYQNALEHIQNNLANYQINLTAADSRIEDADMAKEIMEFVKKGILASASQSMLVQANQLPQTIFTLLK